MSFWDDINPFDTDDGHFWDYVPVVAGIRDLAQGKGGWETLGDFTGLAPVIAGGQDAYKYGKKAVGAIGDELDKPYQEKAKGYDAIREETERLKKARRAQMDETYALANSKLQPSRDAIQAVYGDPRSWKL